MRSTWTPKRQLTSPYRSPDNTTSHILGRFSAGDKCTNDDRVVKLICLNHLVIASTRFDYPKSYLVLQRRLSEISNSPYLDRCTIGQFRTFGCTEAQTVQNVSKSRDSRQSLKSISGWLVRTASTPSRKQKPKTQTMRGCHISEIYTDGAL